MPRRESCRSATQLDRSPHCSMGKDGTPMNSTSTRELSSRNAGPTVYTSPAWLPFALTLVTGGAYLIIWAGRSWSTMKRERGDPEMRPRSWAPAVRSTVPKMACKTHSPLPGNRESGSGSSGPTRGCIARACGRSVEVDGDDALSSVSRTGSRVAGSPVSSESRRWRCSRS